MRQFLMAAVLTLAAPLALAGDITLINGEWLPLQSEHLPGYGVLSRVVSEAFALEGVKVRYLFRPWPRAIAEARSGVADGSMVWSKGAPGSVRNRDFLFSDVVFEGKSVFFHRTDRAFSWTTLADLSKYRVGGVAGYEYEFEKLPGVRIDRAPSEEMSMRKLIAGRFDVYPTLREVGLYTLRTHFSAAEAARVTLDPGRPYNLARYHLILPRRLAASPRHLAVFNKGLRRLKQSGRYAELMAELEAGRY